jgi:peptide deformylase
MKDLELVYFPDERLETRCEEVDIENIDFDPVELKTEMFKAMNKQNGIGISANQLGMNMRAFCILNMCTNNTHEMKMLAINPEVISEEGEVEMFEGCLSMPDIILKIVRPYTIKARWINEKLRVVEQELTGMTARAFLHELDHLNGVTMKDHVAPIKWKEACAEAEKKQQQ